MKDDTNDLEKNYLQISELKRKKKQKNNRTDVRENLKNTFPSVSISGQESGIRIHSRGEGRTQGLMK